MHVTAEARICVGLAGRLTTCCTGIIHPLNHQLPADGHFDNFFRVGKLSDPRRHKSPARGHFRLLLLRQALQPQQRTEIDCHD